MANTIQVVQSGGRGFFGMFFGFLWKFISFAFTLRGSLSLTLIFLVITSIGAIEQSITQQTPLPIFKEIGGKILNFDHKLYIHSKELTANGGIIINSEGFQGKLDALWGIIVSMTNVLYGWWFFYVLCKFWYWFFGLLNNNKSAILSNMLLMMIAVYVFALIGQLIVLDEVPTPEITLPQKFFPFYGLVESVKTLRLIFNPVFVYESGNEPSILIQNISVNTSIENRLTLGDIVK